MSILHNKPVFQLNVEVFGTTHYIKVNGVTVIFDVGEDSQTSVILPVNHWMRPDENSIGVNVYPSKRGATLNPNSYVRLALTVHDLSEPDKVYTIATLNFSGEKDANQSHVGSSSTSGLYSSVKEFIADKNGDVHVYDAVVVPRKTFAGALIVERKINIPSSLPLWAFFCSDKITNYQITCKDNDEYSKAMIPLFTEYMKIYDALEKKDIEAILPMFEERNRETDMAFYREPGTTATRMREALSETIRDLQDNNMELVEIDTQSVDFHLEDNEKVVSLRREGLTHAIILNYINKKKGMGAEIYPMFFRYQNGKYILTR